MNDFALKLVYTLLKVYEMRMQNLMILNNIKCQLCKVFRSAIFRSKIPTNNRKKDVVYEHIVLIYLLLCLKVLITFFKMLQVCYPNMKTFKINTDS